MSLFGKNGMSAAENTLAAIVGIILFFVLYFLFVLVLKILVNTLSPVFHFPQFSYWQVFAGFSLFCIIVNIIKYRPRGY